MTKAILSSNTIQIDDNLLRSKQLEQTNGVLQGDPLSPLLFNIMTMDIVDAVISKHVNMYIYADDMVIASRSQEELQAAFNRLMDWAAENDLDVNDSKTVVMVFRKGGRISANTGITYRGKKLNIVDSFKYLGLTTQTQGCVFIVMYFL